MAADATFGVLSGAAQEFLDEQGGIASPGSADTVMPDPNSTRAWTRAFLTAWPQLDGLLSESTMTGSPCMTLFAPATGAFPTAPLFSEPLNHAGLAQPLAHTAQSINYQMII